MDILTIAGVLAAVSAAGAAGAVWGRGTVETDSPVLINTSSTTTSAPVAVINGHVHECNHYEEDTLGWRCYACWKNGVYTPMERAVNNRG